MKNVTVINHPLVQHNLTRLRDARTQPQEFRRLLNEIAALMTYEATRSFAVKKISVRTPLEKTTRFAKKVFLQHDYSSFEGDRRFVQNDYSSRIFSWERASIAGLYVWRMNHAASAEEKNRMADEADFAFRQALALCPYNSEAAKSYGNFLKRKNRDGDAALVDEMTKQFLKKK